MKKLILILIIIQFIKANNYAQYYNCSLDNSTDINTYNWNNDTSPRSLVEFYGVEFNGFNTSSGFKGGYEIAFYAKSFNKSMEIGAYLDKKMFSLSGLSLTHRLYIFKKSLVNYYNLRPYFFYNLIYRITYLDSVSVSDPGMAMILKSSKTRYVSLEHYLGIGGELKIYHSIYMNANLGFGRYYGSIKKEVPTGPDSKFNMGSNGWGGYFKIGIGYSIP